MIESILITIENLDQRIHGLSNAEVIDINKSDWMEIAKKNSQLLTEKISAALEKVREGIYKSSDTVSIMKQIKKSEYVRKYIEYSLIEIAKMDLNEEDVKKIILMFIIADMSSDARDSIVYFNDVINFFAKNKIEFKNTIKLLLPYANQEIKKGVQISTNDFLKSFLVSN